MGFTENSPVVAFAFVVPINIFPLNNLIILFGSALPSIVGDESFVSDVFVVICGSDGTEISIKAKLSISVIVPDSAFVEI